MAETFHVYICPACNDWQLEDHDRTPEEELEKFMEAHIYECFGISEILDGFPLYEGGGS